MELNDRTVPGYELYRGSKQPCKIIRAETNNEISGSLK